jgi:NADH:ubiquinone oxidoreductase subunit 3 (subunit A)
MTMESIMLNPPVALLINIGLVAVLYGLGRFMAGASQASPLKTSTYSSGEEPPELAAAPGYRPFFVVALFFAVLHLGALVLGTGATNIIGGIYLIGLALVLVALILG